MANTNTNITLEEAVGDALGSTVTSARPVSGGDINLAYELTLADGRVVFAKTNVRADPAMFPAEARGLAWLAEPGVLRVPRVLAVGDAATDGPPFLALEKIASGRRKADFDERLGRGLAALHRAGAPGGFGLDHSNFIGRLPQDNTPLAAADAGWAAFYRDRRLEPQLRAAVDQGLATRRMRAGFVRLFAVLGELVGPPEPPARLHGDLWGGNLLVDDAGEPCLIDPAVYGGHREVDLGMMRLFGGFSERVFDAYHEAWPLAPGHDERVPLYQLYFLMVHVNLFGGSYVPGVESALDRLA
jgi:fructosamine-3-kinase